MCQIHCVSRTGRLNSETGKLRDFSCLLSAFFAAASLKIETRKRPTISFFPRHFLRNASLTPTHICDPSAAVTLGQDLSHSCSFFSKQSVSRFNRRISHGTELDWRDNSMRYHQDILMEERYQPAEATSSHKDSIPLVIFLRSFASPYISLDLESISLSYHAGDLYPLSVTNIATTPVLQPHHFTTHRQLSTNPVRSPADTTLLQRPHHRPRNVRPLASSPTPSPPPPSPTQPTY